MIFTFIIPSARWEASAGVRIRYNRLKPFFEAANIFIDIVALENLTYSMLEKSDLVVISKIFGPDSIKIISTCRELDKKVGIDLFDDYFSDPTLTVFRRQHDWLKLASNLCDFLICSTDRMKEVALKFLDRRFVHKINDTTDPQVSINQTQDLLESKDVRKKSRYPLRVAWFGMGDNPYFDVGLHDLYTYSNSLSALTKQYPYLEFTILTNERSLITDNLSKISRLPVEPTLKIWTEDYEKDLLRESDIILMPVSNQNFSIAKSPNRCLTALSFGCQVLSTGFPLYDDFSSLIYSSTDQLIYDLNKKYLKFNTSSIKIYKRICDQTYQSEHQVDLFLRFLNKHVFKKKTQNIIKYAIIDFKLKNSRFNVSNQKSNYLQIDGNRLAQLDNSDLWLGKIAKKNAIFISAKAQKMLKYDLKSHFRPVNSEPCQTPNHYYILATDLKKMTTQNPNNIEKLFSFRYSKSGPDKGMNKVIQGIL